MTAREGLLRRNPIAGKLRELALYAAPDVAKLLRLGAREIDRLEILSWGGRTCNQGHPWTLETRYFRRDGSSYCRTCYSEKARTERRRRQKVRLVA